MYFPNRGLASPSPFPRGTTLHLSNRADAPPDRNQPWTKSVNRNGAEMGGFPPFQLRIPSCQPMLPQSQFLYTSLASSRTLKIPSPERGGLRTPPLQAISHGYSRPSSHGTGSGTVLDPPERRQRWWDLYCLCHCPPRHRPSVSARRFRHTSRDPRQVQLLQYNQCNKADTEPQQTPRPNRPPKPRITPLAGSKRSLIASCNAVQIPLQPGHWENRPGAIVFCRRRT